MGPTPAELERRLVFAEVHVGLFGRASPVDVGRYIVTGRLGHGGMGVVYRAYDPQLDRKVALKVLHPTPTESRGDPARHERLLREARALGRLAHPNVVAVHDVGVVGEQVYVAMELVEGPSLDQWSTAKPRSSAEIRRVFAAAGRGLLAVHEAGLVHRDFKPSNVIVGDDGRVRVVDFGLAKPLADRSSSSDDGSEPGDGVSSSPPRSLTRSGAVVGTPSYMAPEQARGEPGDARADQYAFCVALHEALYGVRPGSPRAVAVAPAVAGAPAEVGARPRPRGWVPRRLHRALRRGLQERPEDRFPTMEPLVAQLDRRPVGPAWALAAAVGLAGLGAALMTRADEPDPCAAAAGPVGEVWTDAVRQRLASHFARSGAPRADDTWRRVEAALDARADGWRAMARDSCEATRVRAEQSETTLALRTACLDHQADELGATLDVLGTIDAERMPEALLAVHGLPPRSDCEPGPRLAATGGLWGHDPGALRSLRVRLARVRAQLFTRDYQGALEGAEAVLDDAEALGDPPLRAEALHQLGRALARVGQYEAAAARQREAILVAMEHRHEELEARARVELMRVSSIRGEQAQEAIAPALAAARRWGAPRMVALAHRVSGVVRQGAGDFEAAQADYAQALELAQTLEDQGLVVAQIQIAIGTLAAERGDVPAAAVHFEQALAASVAELGDDHPRIAPALANLAAAHRELGELEAARREHERALVLQRSALPATHPEIATTLANLGGVYFDLGEPERAASLAQEAVTILEGSLGPEHLDVAWAAGLLALARSKAGDADGAVAASRQVLSIYRAKLAAEDPRVVSAWLDLARAQREAGAIADAHESATAALALATTGAHAQLRAQAQTLVDAGGEAATRVPAGATIEP